MLSHGNKQVPHRTVVGCNGALELLNFRGLCQEVHSWLHPLRQRLL